MFAFLELFFLIYKEETKKKLTTTSLKYDWHNTHIFSTQNYNMNNGNKS